MENTKKAAIRAKGKPRGDDPTIAEKRGTAPGKSNLPVEVSEQAKASSALARINVPLNTNNWKALPEDQQEMLTWFHQHLLNEGIGWKEVEAGILSKGDRKGGFYDRSTVFRILHGTYEGSWDNICKSILDYRTIWNERKKLVVSTFAENEVSRLIWGALDYALAAKGITEVCGESGQGKTISVKEWQERNNHGKTVYVECPVVGGIKGLLREICAAIGANKNQNIPQMCESVYRAFNPNRILIIDEAARLLPSDKATPPKNLDELRRIHDKTGCALALITTARFGATLRSNSWMFEQVLGRIDMPVLLPRELSESSWLPLVAQYIEKPSAALRKTCDEIVNTQLGGRMRRLDKVLKFASKIASTDKEDLAEKHVFSALKILQRMMGETQYAKKG